MILVLLALLQAPCDPGKRKQGELAADIEPWFNRHAKECTLCADGSACREGYDRRAGLKRAFDAWRAGHAANGCAACAGAAVNPRCPALDSQKLVLNSEAQAKHRVKDAKCDFDPARCEAWRAVTDDLKKSLDAWRKDHAGVCERCGPDCEEWRKKSKEASARAEESLSRHRERCGDCKAGACDRAAVIKDDAVRQRQTAWRSHTEMCACAKGKR